MSGAGVGLLLAASALWMSSMPLATWTDPVTGSVHVYYVYTGTDDCELGDPGTMSDDVDPAVIWFSRSIQN